MNELRRTAYLDALGIDSYISRAQLPGAAPTRRLAIVPVSTTPVASARQDGVNSITTNATPPEEPREAFTPSEFVRSERSPDPADKPSDNSLDAPQDTPVASEPAPRFNLVTMIAGKLLWLEDLSGMPLATEQVQLVQSMARALALCGQGENANSGVGGEQVFRPDVARPDVAHFEWPMHNNRQLDLGEQAARACVAAFVGRKLEEHRCRGLVLLGRAGAQRVTLEDLSVVAVTTASSAEILADPALKRQVWRDLQPLLGK